MTCAEFKEMVGAFALGLLEETERDACAAHVGSGAIHPGCRAALAKARDVACWLAAGLPMAGRSPAPGVWRTIECLVSQPRPANTTRPANTSGAPDQATPHLDTP